MYFGVVSFYSVIMSLLWFTVSAVLFSIALRHASRGGLLILLMLCVLTLLRVFLPLDLEPFVVIHSHTVYPFVMELLAAPVAGLTVLQWLLVLWGIGTAVSTFRLVWSQVRQRRYLSRLDAVPPEHQLYRLCRAEADAMQYANAITVRISSVNGTVYLTGLRRPELVFPANAGELSDDALRHMARHELSHFLGRDLWFKLLLRILKCLLWWNPAVYLLSSSADQMMELRCDDKACAGLTEKEQMEYLQTILQLLDFKSTIHKQLAAGFAVQTDDAQLTQRFQFVLARQKSAKATWRLVICCALCCLVFWASYVFILQPYTPPPMEEIGSGYVAITAENAWLVPTEGGYELYIDGEYSNIITKEMMETKPFCNLPIFKGEEAYDE